MAAVGETAATVSETIDERGRPWGGMGDRTSATRPAIRTYMNVYVEGERARLETPLGDGRGGLCADGDQRG